ncbi:hypothetical protein CONPUDRAFT_117150 [Coniophora puteana RWD-64-598 SS2]|uniref:Six-hairpin glycosidase n=1 Tax=Coniophora puteana (strain RWD-64-598) TaxID=741705 RepID=A0A5M3N0J0_CONPW|nr:uncharacterized protein CONPUDRAFT_117150 [Coniophora puteana RWD-64-598 SS2]EIW84902.1 hypothetical protein CONPUDRAFT_117150 [Coniophora puteana RWD-64-598 SS2]
MISVTSVLALLAAARAASAQSPLAPKAYNYLPLGAVKPAGWLHDQVMVQTNGLAGQQSQFYNYVHDSDWTGGSSFYSNLEEAGSYWFNGIVPNAFVLGSSDSDLQTQATNFLTYVFDNQDSTGWLGPEVFDTSKPRYLWGRYLFLFGAIQMIENNPSLADTYVPKIWSFVNLAYSMVQNNNTGLEEWGNARWEEFIISLQWLYENHPNGNEAMLLDFMNKLKTTGVQWDQVFSEQNFPQGPTEGLTNPFNNTLVWHGVNVAEGVKAAAVAYRFTNDTSLLQSASDGWDRLFQYHGRPSGIFSADEYLAGLDAHRGTELCDVVETMFSGSYLFQVTGDIKYLDRAERIAYNALPGTLTGSMWSRQYLQQQNQVAAQNMVNNPFPQDGPYSNVFGLEPNYPCCTVNHPQGWPKFVSNAFVTTPDGNSLVQAYLGPFSTSTSLNGNNVQVDVDTMYPFADTLTTTITADKAFTFYVRVPSWVSGGTFATNGGAAQPLAPSNGLQAVQAGAGTTTLDLVYTPEITTEDRPAGSIAVHRGPLHYAYDIARTQKQLAQNADQALAVDLEFDANAPWQYAIDTTTLAFASNLPTQNGTLPSPIWDTGLPPVSMTVTACPIDWALAGTTYAAVPPTSPSCTGNPTNITLWPYGATKLRIGEFPQFTVPS